MGRHIIDIEGIGPKYAEKLEAVGIVTIEELLEKGASQAGRKELEKETGIDAKRMLDWIGMADMFRIKGIGKQFAELLKAAGVDTVKELRTRNAENLEVKLYETNEEKQLTRAVPSHPQIQNWINQASQLEAKLTY